MNIGLIDVDKTRFMNLALEWLWTDKPLDAAMTRLSDLETTKRILKEMEQKGTEL